MTRSWHIDATIAFNFIDKMRNKENEQYKEYKDNDDDD
ncbi:hypothetical protein L289_1771 [Acinetobacter gerneri DSM 14967 = CIP 107464 = MTCC 9824]|nr:hypothetical protein L289_1771 [Acinetobacter gerneri DSM 14967 = CIP 107464 = MTCC 9824]